VSFAQITCVSCLRTYFVSGAWQEKVKGGYIRFLLSLSGARPPVVLVQFLHATAATAVARLSHCNSVCLSVCHTGGSAKKCAS